MKIPFTEKALKDLYNFLEATVSGIGQIVPPPLIRPPRPYYYIPSKDYNAYSKFFTKKYCRKKFYQFIDYLKRHGYLKIKKLKNYRIIGWTPKGLNKILYLAASDRLKKKKLNGKYLMIIFDIPERCRKKRDYLRKMLKLLGYKQLQKSIWISALDVFKETENLIKIQKIEPYAQLFVLEKIKFK